jgi:type 2 lantibiotic biosynthesis protein LanM
MKISKQYIYALQVNERIEAFNKLNILVSEDPLIIDEKWFNINSLIGKSLFDKKLELMNLTSEQFAFAIKDFSDYEMFILNNYLTECSWYLKYVEIMNDFESSGAVNTVENEQLILPFKKYLVKIISNYSYNNLIIDQRAINNLIENITSQISKLTWKALITELQDYKCNNTLKGETPHEKYLYFIKMRYDSANKIERFYCKYPVLARLIVQKVLDLTTEVETMLNNINYHFKEISNILDLESNHITSILCSQGDTHNRGKSVTRIIFGNESSFVYKPRNSYVERAFNQFLEYVNTTSNLKDLYINNVYYAKDFTCENYINSLPCYSINEVKDFYYRFGEIIAFISMLRGTDFHSENIIAVNKYPVIVDHETFFTQLYISAKEVNGYLYSINNKNDFMNISSTALLPLYGLDNNLEKKGVDVSGLSGGSSVLIPKKVLVMKDLYTDRMRYEYSQVQKKPDNNRPILNDQIMNFKNFKNEIYAGFRASLNYLNNDKDNLTVLIRKLFKNIEVRQVIKSSAIYSDLISYADHPNYLKNMIYLERLFDNSYAYPHQNKNIVNYEIMNMLYLEIPIFYTNTSKNYLLTSNGYKFKRYYKECSLDSVLNDFSLLTNNIIDNEILKLNILLGDYKYLINQRIENFTNDNDIKNNKDYTKMDILQICINIGKKIISSSYYSKNKKYITWKYVDTSNEYPAIAFMKNSLYNGRTGILLFMHYLTHFTSVPEFKKFTYQLYKSISASNEEIEQSVYHGLASTFYIQMKLRDTKYINLDLIYFRNVLIDLINKPITDSVDRLGGVAGYIGFFNIINDLCIEKHFSILLLEKYTNHLINILDSEQVNITSLGFGHGEIGLLYALLISQSTLNKDFGKQIESLFTKIDEKIDNIVSTATPNINSWCHGFSGLGIGAIECKKYINDSRLDRYINYSFKIINKDDSTDMCLCHGLGGDIDFLISMSHLYPNNDKITKSLQRKIKKIIYSFDSYDTAVLNELPEYSDFSLYTGLSGVGMILLRYIYPENLQSILTIP